MLDNMFCREFCVNFFERDRMLVFICLHLWLFKFSLQHHLSNLTVSFILCMTNTLIKIFKKISQLVWRYFGLAKEWLLVETIHFRHELHKNLTIDYLFNPLMKMNIQWNTKHIESKEYHQVFCIFNISNYVILQLVTYQNIETFQPIDFFNFAFIIAQIVTTNQWANAMHCHDTLKKLISCSTNQESTTLSNFHRESIV